MTVFAVGAALLVLVTLAILIPVLWKNRLPGAASAEQKEANLAIFRDQLAELDTERAEGSLSETDYQQARAEVERRLLEDVAPDAGLAAPVGANARTTAVVTLVSLPILAAASYLILGNPQALLPEARTPQPAMSAADINALVERLAERMKQNPDDMKGWLMLARSYTTQGRYDQAAEAFAKAEVEVVKNPDLLANYAEVLAIAEGKGLQGKPLKLVNQALALDPQHPHALFLAGASAMERGEPAKGINYWQALLPMVEPGSDIEKMLQDGIAKARERVK